MHSEGAAGLLRRVITHSTIGRFSVAVNLITQVPIKSEILPGLWSWPLTSILTLKTESAHGTLQV